MDSTLIDPHLAPLPEFANKRNNLYIGCLFLPALRLNESPWRSLRATINRQLLTK